MLTIIIQAIILSLWLFSFIISITVFRSPLMWSSRWFWSSLIIPGLFFLKNTRKNIEQDIFELILKKAFRNDYIRRFVIIEKSGNYIRKAMKCSICQEVPSNYNSINSFDFFSKRKTEFGLECECGIFYKKFNFGYLNISSDAYVSLVRGYYRDAFSRIIINDWNNYGHSEKKIKMTRKHAVFH